MLYTWNYYHIINQQYFNKKEKKENLNFYTSKYTVNRLKMQPITWKNRSANHISDKQIISRIHK